MEIKTREQYVLDQLEQARAERDWLRGKLEQAQDEAEELRGKLMERGERDASKVEQAIRKEGRRKLYRDGTGYFKYHQGAGAGGVGAEPEQSPTLTADWHNPAVYPIDEPITMADLNANTAIGYDMVGTLKVGGDAPSVCL